VIFNGIPGDLTERSDLASRTIKLEISRIVQRRTKSDLEREFEAIWPGVLGSLLDGLVGGLRDQASVKVDDPARLMTLNSLLKPVAVRWDLGNGNLLTPIRPIDMGRW